MVATRGEFLCGPELCCGVGIELYISLVAVRIPVTLD